MGIRVVCPNGHKLNVKSFLAGKRGVCPHCGAKFDIPAKKADSSEERVQSVGQVAAAGTTATATVPSADSAEMRASHLAKGSGIVRRGAPVTATAPAVAATPMAPVAPVRAAAIGPAAAPLPGVAQAVPIQPMSVQPFGAQGGPFGAPGDIVPGEIVPGAAPLGLAPGTPVPSALVRPAVVDPLAEAPEASWYVRPPSGGQYGPAKPPTMRDWLAQGRITADSLVWREGWPDWKLAGATFPSLGAVGPVAGGPAAAQAVAGPMPASAAATDDPFAVLGPGSPSTALSTARRSRRSGNSARVMAIAVLCLALVILSALLVYVLKLQ